ncbi:MAG: LCP family protein [Clostridia bacterium]|nr:LCP family protein [Clostridia bacterium]
MKFFLRFFIFLLVLSTLILTLGASAMGESKPSAAVSALPKSHGITRFLVMGRDRAAGLTDSIFVVTLDETKKQASILQIPRDTYAAYTERDYKKLNGALQVLGAEKTTELLSSALGVRLDYFAVIDLDCVQGLVDAVGGVDVVLPEALAYSDPEQGLEIQLPQGAVHLDGKRAEHLLRFRSGYVNADLGRLDAQKLFLQAFAQKCKTLNPLQMIEVLGVVFTRVQTNIDLPTACRLAVGLLHFDTDTIPMATMAGEAVQGTSGAWYYVINRPAGAGMVTEYCLPTQPLTETDFDPDGIFDRRDHADFHKIYTADPETGGE